MSEKREKRKKLRRIRVCVGKVSVEVDLVPEENGVRKISAEVEVVTEKSNEVVVRVWLILLVCSVLRCVICLLEGGRRGVRGACVVCGSD